MSVELNLGREPDAELMAIISSAPITALGCVVENRYLTYRDSVLEFGELTENTSVTRPEPGVWEVHDHTRGVSHMRLRSNDLRAVMLAILMVSPEHDRSIHNLNAPEGVIFDQDDSCYSLRWATDSWLQHSRGSTFWTPLAIGHIIAASDVDIAASVRASDGAPLYSSWAAGAARKAQTTGIDFSHFDLESWREWLAQRDEAGELAGRRCAARLCLSKAKAPSKRDFEGAGLR